MLSVERKAIARLAQGAINQRNLTHGTLSELQTVAGTGERPTPSAVAHWHELVPSTGRRSSSANGGTRCKWLENRKQCLVQLVRSLPYVLTEKDQKRSQTKPMSQDTKPYMLSQGEGKSVWSMGLLITFKAEGENTANGFALCEFVLPVGFAPPPHLHHREDQAFYILEGTLQVTCGDQTFTATPGCFVYLPRGIAHGFQVAGNQPARLLEMTTPTGFEHYYEEMGEPARTLTLPPPKELDIPKMLSLMAKYLVDNAGAPPHGP